MGRRIGPVCRLCRREGIKLFLKGIRCTGDKCAIEKRNQPPGMHPRSRGKLSDYGLQLREKQKAKKIYGTLERQFRTFFARAAKKRGVTGETLIQLLERRLDNLIYRVLFVPSRAEARQLVSHGLITVNGRTVNIPSFQVRVGDVIEPYHEESLKKRIQNNLEMLRDRPLPEWLELDRETLEAKVVRLPGKADAGLPVEESQIVELYSK
ncbi:MAG: 30S ribosomal protein S4 [Candidatus Omnitrophica bacterium]|nr:30S ribosomal protein S4 [Candidatus Omnitrophota bacterium]